MTREKVLTSSVATVSRSDDPRYRRSLQALESALLHLLQTRPLDEITITAFVQAAGVTRPTFYQHFQDIADAARRLALKRLDTAFPKPEPFSADFEMTQAALFEHVRKQALPVIRHLQKERVFYLRVLDGAGNAVFFEEVVAFLASRFLPDAFEMAARSSTAERDDLMALMAGGAMWLMVRWLRTAESTTPEEMAERLSAAAVTMIASDAQSGQRPRDGS
ncbi:TetR-like C-terminal domain-containing protein [Aureimonas mangrovi]|uniref:TetR-like C-terminal domain-containing protein n=1 Tax=Aureimonas mangrovi TaxID=2758041 RepID=UPI00163DB93F|nr:TetR-like C-terminal domain-containing protein [Aureimonas mangrovi]